MTEKATSVNLITGLQKSFHEENEQLAARQKELDKQIDNTTPGGDKSLPSNQQHDYSEQASKQKNFDQKIYLFPQSFNALRRELHDNWKVLFYQTPCENGAPLSWNMAHDAVYFVAMLNDALDLHVQFDTENVSGICHTFLNALRKKRGLSELSS